MGMVVLGEGVSGVKEMMSGCCLRNCWLWGGGKMGWNMG